MGMAETVRMSEEKHSYNRAAGYSGVQERDQLYRVTYAFSLSFFYSSFAVILSLSPGLFSLDLTSSGDSELMKYSVPPDALYLPKRTGENSGRRGETHRQWWRESVKETC